MINNIARLRIEKGLTQEEFAGLIDISRPYLSDIENNKSNPTIEVATRIAKKLGKPMEQIFFEEDVNHVEHDRSSA